MKLKLQVKPTHRFAEVSLRAKTGKLWVGKGKPVTVDTEELLPGEDLVIQRYEAEGRLIVKEVKPKEAKT